MSVLGYRDDLRYHPPQGERERGTEPKRGQENAVRAYAAFLDVFQGTPENKGESWNL